MTMIEVNHEQATIPFHGRMTLAQFDAERARLRGLYGDSRKEAGARYEQALARLYLESGWTPVEIATREGKGVSKSRVSQMLIFARFIWFLKESTMVDSLENIPLGLNERRFRLFWIKTSGGNDRDRFRNAINLMQEADATPKPTRGKELGKAVAAQFADGKWRDIETIAKQVGWPLWDVRSVLDNMVVSGSFGCTAAKKPVAKSFHFRIFPQDRQVSTVELVEELQPLLDVLKMEGKKNMATMSPPTVAYHTDQIQALLNKWAGRPSKGKKA